MNAATEPVTAEEFLLQAPTTGPQKGHLDWNIDSVPHMDHTILRHNSMALHALHRACQVLTCAKALAFRTAWPMTIAVVISRPSTMTKRMPLGRWNNHGRSMLIESLRPTVLPAAGPRTELHGMVCEQQLSY